MLVLSKLGDPIDSQKCLSQQGICFQAHDLIAPLSPGVLTKLPLRHDVQTPADPVVNRPAASPPQQEGG